MVVGLPVGDVAVMECEECGEVVVTVAWPVFAGAFYAELGMEVAHLMEDVGVVDVECLDVVGEGVVVGAFAFMGGLFLFIQERYDEGIGFLLECGYGGHGVGGKAQGEVFAEFVEEFSGMEVGAADDVGEHDAVMVEPQEHLSPLRDVATVRGEGHVGLEFFCEGFVLFHGVI